MEAGIFRPDIPVASFASSGRKRFFIAALSVSFVFHLGVMSFIPKFGTVEIPDNQPMISFQMNFVAPASEAAPEHKEKSAPEKKTEKPTEKTVSDKKTSHSAKSTDKTGAGNNKSTAESSVIPIIRNPSVRSQNPPVYPASARRMGYQGTVVIHALIGTDGHIGNVKIVSSSGFESLDNSAVKAVGSWIFDTNYADGKPVKAWVEVPVRFILQDM